MNQKTLRSESGMTLIEIMVALTIFSIVIAGALSTLNSHSEGYRIGTDRMTLLQNLRFAANTLEKDLRVVGANIPDDQPYLILLDDDVIAFSGDYATNVAGDPYAVYYDPDSPAGTVNAMTSSMRLTIPNSTFGYPDTSYMQSGVNSPAETLIFFFTADSSTSRIDDFALFRQINSGTPELVARNILQTNGADFFEYYRHSKIGAQPIQVTKVPAASLPLRHSAKNHLSVNDTGAVALIDSVRGVRVNFTTTNGRSGADEQTRAVTRLIQMPNAGLAVKLTCGDEPLLGVAFAATFGLTTQGDPRIRLTWGQAIDESGGEQDVTRYSIWRREMPAIDWGDPFLSIPSGQASYVYDDETVESGQSYAYAIAALDCTPSLSSLATSATIAIP